MHELHTLTDNVLRRTEEAAWYLHTVHDHYGAIDIETHVKVSTLLVDLRAELERRGMTVPRAEAPMRTQPDDDSDADDSGDDGPNGNPDNGVYTGGPS